MTDMRFAVFIGSKLIGLVPPTEVALIMATFCAVVDHDALRVDLMT